MHDIFFLDIGCDDEIQDIYPQEKSDWYKDKG